MGEAAPATSQAEPADIKRVPQDASVREAVRARAKLAAAHLDHSRPPLRADVERHAASILDELSLPRHFLGSAMVAVSNAFWRPQFEATRFDRRLLFLPCCLRDSANCQGKLDADGLECVNCCDCAVSQLKTAAKELGYRVIVAEGTPAVVTQLSEFDLNAISGVACLDSLDKAFDKATEIGVPCIALPLLKDGCTDTEVDTRHILSVLRSERAAPATTSRTYAPLLRESVRLFEPGNLSQLLEPVLPGAHASTDTDTIALDWIDAGGKRFRPFVTLAAYTVSMHGASALADDADIAAMIPESVRRIAVAIEALHKASLVHDDIEDDDAFRYGRETLHRTHGLAPAINAGDYLIGLGYRLVSAQAAALGSECAADILAQLSGAHIELCRGQGDELLWQRGPSRTLRPIDALSIYARKTAPAFEAALFAGLRPAGTSFDPTTLKQFSIYVGEAYQILNDLADWDKNADNKVSVGRDVLAGRPTLLRAFAIDAGASDRLAQGANDPANVRQIYEDSGVFDKARRLVDKLRSRASALADQTQDTGLGDLLHFIVRIVL